MCKFVIGVILSTCLATASVPSLAQQSVARQWNEELLNAIRQDLARPTVHARNLFHISAAMYDAWSVYDPVAEPFLLGKDVGGFYCAYSNIPMPDNVRAAREEAMSYAAYRLIKHRFKNSPGAADINIRADKLMQKLGYAISQNATDYASGSAAQLGNYIAQCYINYGLQDGANEQGGYQNQYYKPVNPPLEIKSQGNPFLKNPNRWQPLSFDVFIDQGGNPGANSPPFLSPEWGWVTPFALDESTVTERVRDDLPYLVYDDPGTPPQLLEKADSEEYKWNFLLVAMWSGHLDPSDNVSIDISPASIGNVQALPNNFEEMKAFYSFEDGGDTGTGYTLNPITEEPYTPQMVSRGDYTRVLAEFWADGPDSETPPGHWFTILNYVHDHPLFEPRFKGEGPLVDKLEWDTKAYFALGGAMHDCAIAAWSIKGYYDFIRPVSAIRYLGQQGQSSDPQLPHYSPDGLPLIPNAVELVKAGDALAGSSNENVDKIKIYAWLGPTHINNPNIDEAGVGWILAENWWPYQRPSFVTPPFAGYVSGHSTFSRAAAELLTALTGDPFFPGGLGEFKALKNRFLVFEEGPQADLTLQWATYIDASDQCSLSRIWGGIHPPADDIPGRKIGQKIGVNSLKKAEKYFDGTIESSLLASDHPSVYPNPISKGEQLQIEFNGIGKVISFQLSDSQGRLTNSGTLVKKYYENSFKLPIVELAPGVYILNLRTAAVKKSIKLLIQ